MTEMTDKEYVEKGGNECPYCSSQYIKVVSDIQTNLHCAWNDVVCEGCGKEWQDIYTFTGFQPKERKNNGEH